VYSKVDAKKRRRMWLESMADRGVSGYASDVQPVATREVRQPPARPRPEVPRAPGAVRGGAGA